MCFVSDHLNCNIRTGLRDKTYKEQLRYIIETLGNNVGNGGPWTNTLPLTDVLTDVCGLV